MKYKIFFLILTLIVGNVFLRAESYTGSCGSNLSWTLNTDDSTLTIIGSGTMLDYNLPSMYESPENTMGPWYTHRAYIKNILLPEGLTYIGSYAFYDCPNLISVTIPNNVTSIGNAAFMVCTSLTSINIPNSVVNMGNNICNACTNLVSATIGNNVTSIGDYAFVNCNNMTSITIGNSVTSIGYCAFANCYGLTSIILPNSITSIGENAFNMCKNLKSINIPYGVTSINYMTFAYCYALTSVTIPSSVSNIGEHAFSMCTGLKTIINNAATPQNIGKNVFTRVNKSSCTLYVPMNSIEQYQTANIWKDFINIHPSQAEESEVTSIQILPTDSNVIVKWPAVTEAIEYTIIISQNNEIVCTLRFNAEGQLLSVLMAAPSKQKTNRRLETADSTSTGWQYSIEGLDADTEYIYTITALKNDNTVAYSTTGSFRTQSATTGINALTSKYASKSYKVLHNGHIFIMYADKTFNVQGQQVK